MTWDHMVVSDTINIVCVAGKMGSNTFLRGLDVNVKLSSTSYPQKSNLTGLESCSHSPNLNVNETLWVNPKQAVYTR